MKIQAQVEGMCNLVLDDAGLIMNVTIPRTLHRHLAHLSQHEIRKPGVIDLNVWTTSGSTPVIMR